MAATLELVVKGMTCGGCENAVTRTLQQVRGVEAVTASHAANAVGVTFDASTVTPQTIRKAIEELGYRVEP
jgi:copper chaperone CopZ